MATSRGYKFHRCNLGTLPCRVICPAVVWGSAGRVRHTGAVTSSAPSAPTASTSSRPRRLQPRHALYVVLVGVVVAGIVVLYQKASENTTDLDRGNIERLIPAPDAKVLQQEAFGIDLAPGFEASLTLTSGRNVTVIPDDQTSVVEALNQFTFVPGVGKAFETLPTGQNCVTATYWRTETGPNQSSTRTWCFTVL